MIDLSSIYIFGAFDEWPKKKCENNRFTTSNSTHNPTRITYYTLTIIYNAKGCTKFSIYLSTLREIKFWTFSAFDWPNLMWWHMVWRLYDRMLYNIIKIDNWMKFPINFDCILLINAELCELTGRAVSSLIHFAHQTLRSMYNSFCYPFMVPR